MKLQMKMLVELNKLTMEADIFIPYKISLLLGSISMLPGFYLETTLFNIIVYSSPKEK